MQTLLTLQLRTTRTPRCPLCTCEIRSDNIYVHEGLVLHETCLREYPPEVLHANLMHLLAADSSHNVLRIKGLLIYTPKCNPSHRATAAMQVLQDELDHSYDAHVDR